MIGKKIKCPFCGSDNTTIDIRSSGNLWRLPTTLFVGVFIGPYIKVWMKCKSCDEKFLEYGDDVNL